MTSMQIHFGSPGGTALLLGSTEAKKSRLPTYGMYRVEIDTKFFFAKQPVPDLLMDFFRRHEPSGHVFVSIHSGPEIDLGKSHALVGQNRTSAIYSVGKGESISRDVLELLTALPYGEVAFFDIADEVDLSQHLAALTELDDFMRILGSDIRWAVGFDNDSAIVSFLVKEKSIAKEQVLVVLDRNLDSI